MDVENGEKEIPSEAKAQMKMQLLIWFKCTETFVTGHLCLRCDCVYVYARMSVTESSDLRRVFGVSLCPGSLVWQLAE